MYQVLHPEQNRLLSVREYARSQGFRCVELMINMEKVKRSYNFAQPEPISYIFYNMNILSAMTLSLPAQSETNTER